MSLADDLSNILNRKVKTVLLTDSKCLFDTITKMTTVAEKRLLIDIACIRESYSNGDLSNVAHLSSAHNLANSLTKAKPDPTQIIDLMTNGYLNHAISQWIIPQ